MKIYLYPIIFKNHNDSHIRMHSLLQAQHVIQPTRKFFSARQLFFHYCFSDVILYLNQITAVKLGTLRYTFCPIYNNVVMRENQM